MLHVSPKPLCQSLRSTIRPTHFAVSMRELLRFVIVVVIWVISFLASWFVLSALFMVLVNTAGSLMRHAGVLRGGWGFDLAFDLPAVLSLISSPVLATYLAYRASRLIQSLTASGP